MNRFLKRTSEHLDDILRANMNQALEYYREGDFQKLKEYCRTQVQMFPEQSDFWKLWGVALGNLGFIEEAKGAFKIALQLDPTDSLTLTNLITALMHTEEIALALQLIVQHFEHLPDEYQQVLLESIKGSLKANLFQREELPLSVQARLK